MTDLWVAAVRLCGLSLWFCASSHLRWGNSWHLKYSYNVGVVHAPPLIPLGIIYCLFSIISLTLLLDSVRVWGSRWLFSIDLVVHPHNLISPHFDALKVSLGFNVRNPAGFNWKDPRKSVFPVPLSSMTCLEHWTGVCFFVVKRHYYHQGSGFSVSSV